MAHAQKPHFVFRRKGRFYLNLRGRHFSQLLAAEVCASAVVMLNTPCSEVLCRVLATHSIRHFPLHFPSRASPCAITFQLDSTTVNFMFEFRHAQDNFSLSLFSDRLWGPHSRRSVRSSRPNCVEVIASTPRIHIRGTTLNTLTSGHVKRRDCSLMRC
jgi:hypothetical protein